MFESREDQRLQALRAEMWKKTEKEILARIELLEKASKLLVGGQLTPSLRAEAAGEAHKLAGSLGAFGFMEESRLSQSVAQILRGEPKQHAEEGKHIEGILVQLKPLVEQDAAKLLSGFDRRGRR